MLLNPKVEKYLIDGCMRCPLGGTPQCKVLPWRKIIEHLRQAVLNSDLTEELKWGIPVYTHNGRNIVNIAALKDSVVVGFYKGALMEDTYKLLEQQGRVQSARIIRISDLEKLYQVEKVLLDYIKEAIELEISGKKVPTVGISEPLPEELILAFENDFLFKESFFALTPGRQRGYILHFSQPKNASTRIARIEKHKQNILMGKGMHDDYKK